MLKRVLTFFSLLNAITVSSLGFVILSLVIRHSRLNQTFQWWQMQNLDEDYAESENLRNQALQSLFGIRRQIEQIPLDGSGASILAEIHQCQKDLSDLSDRLFSPYGFDSIPLAITDLWNEVTKDSRSPSRIALQVRGAIDPAQIPDRWRSLAVGESSSFARMNAQLLWVWLRKILKTVLRVDGVERVEIDVALKQSRWQHLPILQVRIQFKCLDSLTGQKLLEQSDLSLVSRMLTQLTPGHCYLTQEDTTLCCVLDWMLIEPKHYRFINF